MEINQPDCVWELLLLVFIKILDEVSEEFRLIYYFIITMYIIMEVL